LFCPKPVTSPPQPGGTSLFPPPCPPHKKPFYSWSIFFPLWSVSAPPSFDPVRSRLPPPLQFYAPGQGLCVKPPWPPFVFMVHCPFTRVQIFRSAHPGGGAFLAFLFRTLETSTNFGPFFKTRAKKHGLGFLLSFFFGIGNFFNTVDFPFWRFFKNFPIGTHLLCVPSFLPPRILWLCTSQISIHSNPPPGFYFPPATVPRRAEGQAPFLHSLYLLNFQALRKSYCFTVVSGGIGQPPSSMKEWWLPGLQTPPGWFPSFLFFPSHRFRQVPF